MTEAPDTWHWHIFCDSASSGGAPQQISRCQWLPDYLRKRSQSRDGQLIKGPLNAAADEIDSLRNALHQIDEWSRAYPLNVFPEPSVEQWEKIAELLKGAGMTLDSFSASNMRHVVDGVGKIAREALGEE